MKTYKFFILSILMAVSFLFTSNLSAQYWRIHVQGISFLVPKGIQTDNTDEGFSAEHLDFNMVMMAVPLTDPSHADNYDVYNSMLNSIEDFEIYEDKTEILDLKGFKGIIVQGNNGLKEMYICIMNDKKKKNLFISVIEDASYTGRAEQHAMKLFRSFE